MKPAVALCAAAVLLAGCRGEPADRAAAALTAAPTATPAVTASSTRSPTASPAPSRTRAPAPRTAPKRIVTKASASPGLPQSPAPRRTTSVPLCPSVPSVQAAQVVLVEGHGSGATVRACERRGGRWVSVMGRMYGHVGLNGVAPPGAKREGDGRTPSGTFSLGTGFGVLSDPGTWFPWHRTTRADVWVDDSSSELYNTRQQKPANGRWDSAEDLYVPGTYDYVQVIDYNTARTPGRGSGIFLHVDHRSGTHGCVSLPRSQLLRVFRWERPGALVVIR